MARPSTTKGKKGGEGETPQHKAEQDELAAGRRSAPRRSKEVGPDVLSARADQQLDEIRKGGTSDDEDDDEVSEEKAGGAPVTADEAKKCCQFVADKLNDKFPKLDGGAGNTEHKNQGFTEHDVHYDIRCKPGLAAYLTASYIESSSECAVDVISGTIVVWVKSFDGKLRSISEKDAIKRWVSGKFDKLGELAVPFAIYFMMVNDHRDCPDVDTLAKAAKNGIGELVGEIHGCLSA